MSRVGGRLRCCSAFADSDTSEWAIIVPCWLMVVVWVTYFAYAAAMVFLAPSFSSPSLITGEYTPLDHVRERAGLTAQIAARTYLPTLAGRGITGSLRTRSLYPRRLTCLSTWSIAYCIRQGGGRRRVVGVEGELQMFWVFGMVEKGKHGWSWPAVRQLRCTTVHFMLERQARRKITQRQLLSTLWHIDR